MEGWPGAAYRDLTANEATRKRVREFESRTFRARGVRLVAYGAGLESRLGTEDALAGSTPALSAQRPGGDSPVPALGHRSRKPRGSSAPVWVRDPPPPRTPRGSSSDGSSGFLIRRRTVVQFHPAPPRRYSSVRQSDPLIRERPAGRSRLPLRSPRAGNSRGKSACPINRKQRDQDPPGPQGGHQHARETGPANNLQGR